eukprot:13645975-Heterocapsa_arctica.AAC.1
MGNSELGVDAAKTPHAGQGGREEPLRPCSWGSHQGMRWDSLLLLLPFLCFMVERGARLRELLQLLGVGHGFQDVV